MSVKFSNNGKTTLSSGVSSSATSIAVADASVFPSITGSEYFYMTLENVSGSVEILKVTSVSSNTLTAVRAQDGTSGISFAAGDKAENRLTAGGLNDVATQADTDTNTTYSVEDGGLTEKNFTTTLKSKLDGVEASADVTDTGNVVAALTAGTNVAIAADGTISSTDTNTTYSVEDGGLTQKNFTTTLKSKLDGIATSANNYSHPSAHTIGFITGLQTALDGKVDDSQVLTNVPENAVFTDNNTTYSVGDGGLTQKNFTTTLKTKLDGIEASADVTDTANVVAALTAGTNVAIAADGTISSTDTNTTYSVGDGGLTQKNFTTTLKSKLDGVEASADVTDTANVVAALTAGTNVAIAANGTISSTDTNTTYSVGDGGLTQKNFTTTLKTKLDGIAESANNYSLPFTDNSANWNTAYGWGDHSTEGYLTSHQSLSGYATETYVDTAVSDLVDSSPAALNTLNELAAALGDDENFSTTVSDSIGTKWTQDNTKISNWDTAYGWGDHASAGYLTSYTDTNTTYSAGTGISLSGTTFNLTDTNAKLNLTGGTLDNGTSTTLSVKCDDAGRALVRAGGDGQGTGIFEVTQDNGSHGGGMSYNGDGSPSWVSGETSDHVTFYRINAGTRTEVFHYPYSSNVVNFNSTPTVGGNSIYHSGNPPPTYSKYLRSDVADTAAGTITFSAGINGFDISNGISGTNFNISGVNQLSINDPGEGIVFQGTTNVTLAAIDDSTDSVMNFANASQLRVDNKNVGTQSVVTTAPTSASGFPNGHVWYVVS